MTRVVIFAKAPVAGAAKTRLIPSLGAAGAAALHARMVERMVTRACEAGIGQVELCCTPDTDAALFRQLAARHTLGLADQGDGDLGQRMWRALSRAIDEVGSGIIVGTDCPALDARVLREAHAALTAGAQVVVGPAEDGGYVLIGARVDCPAVFDNIAWSTDRVMTATRMAIRACGFTSFELPTLWDVDRPEDFDRLRSAFPALALPDDEGVGRDDGAGDGGTRPGRPVAVTGCLR